MLFLLFLFGCAAREHSYTSQEIGRRTVTLVEEVDGFQAGVLLVADLQLVELAEEADEPLHHLHAVLAKPEQIINIQLNRQSINQYINRMFFSLTLDELQQKHLFPG